jgi:hypothetical protein
VLDNLDHSVLRDRIGWHLVGLNVMNKLLRALGLVCLSVGLFVELDIVETGVGVRLEVEVANRDSLRLGRGLWIR